MFSKFAVTPEQKEKDSREKFLKALFSDVTPERPSAVKSFSFSDNVKDAPSPPITCASGCSSACRCAEPPQSISGAFYEHKQTAKSGFKTSFKPTKPHKTFSLLKERCTDKMREGLIDNWAEGVTRKDRRNNLLQDILVGRGDYNAKKHQFRQNWYIFDREVCYSFYLAA